MSEHSASPVDRLNAEAAGERQIVRHLVERAGLEVRDDELDDVIVVHRTTRATADLLFSDRMRELLA